MDRNVVIVWILALVCVGIVYNKPVVPSNWESNLQTVDNKYEVFFEGDMILPKRLVERAVEDGALTNPGINTEGVSLPGNVEAITAPLHRRWPNAVVPYVISSSLKPSFLGLFNPRKHIKNAMAAWSKNTCIKFRPKKPSDNDYIQFTSSRWGHCASYIGHQGGRQKVYLGVGCRSDGTIMHEIGHALGFYHEQSRPDRDQYIKINYNNISKKYWFNFSKYTTGISNMGTPYDYGSIMHYGPNAFKKSFRWFSKSIKPLKKGVEIGQREGLSALDIKEMNLYYRCPQK